MPITVRMFAILRETAGREHVEVPATPHMTVDDVLAHLAAEGVLPEKVVTSGTYLTAVNQRYVDRTAQLEDGDELALIPPVSGG